MNRSPFRSKFFFLLLMLLGFASYAKAQICTTGFAGGTYCPGANLQTSCPTCGIYDNFYNSPFYGTQVYAPSAWWSPYSSWSYPQTYNTPGPMMAYGLQGGMYPGHGHVVGGKPNIYFSGTPGTKFKVKLKFPQDSYMLGAVPVHGNVGWEAKLEKDKMLKTDQAKVPYLFYDFRLSEEKLQDKAGFCVGPDRMISKLMDELKLKGFKEKEIQDFEVYWSVKMPLFEEYCVYPQEERELTKVANLEITPTPKSIKRILFVVIPKTYFKSASGKFAKAPSTPWQQSEPQRMIAHSAIEQLKTLPSEDDFEVREWGVAFLAL